MADVVLCVYDGLRCDRVVDDLGFCACYVKSADGKRVRFICPRFKVGSSFSVVEELVHKDLIPHG